MDQRFVDEIASAVYDNSKLTGFTGPREAMLGDGTYTGVIIDTSTPYPNVVHWHTLSDDGTFTVQEKGIAVLDDKLFYLYENNPFLDGAVIRLAMPPNSTIPLLSVIESDKLATGQQFGVVPLAKQAQNAAFRPSLSSISTLKLKLNPDTLTVSVYGKFVYPTAITLVPAEFDGEAADPIDLTDTSGNLTGIQHQIAVICLDTKTNTLVKLTSSAVNSSSGAVPYRDEFTVDSLSSIDFLNNPTYDPLGVVYMYSGQTEWDTTARIGDLLPIEIRPAYPPPQAFLAIKHKWNATTAPTTGDDSDDGYSVGSRWYDTTNDRGYECYDATVGAAVWKELTTPGSGGGSGSVTNVSATATPTSIFDISVTNPTTTPAIALSMDNQSANQVLAGPSSGGAAAPAFRALVSDDLPTVPIAKGGTGQTSKTPAFDALAPGTTKGDLIVYDGSDNVRKAVGSNGRILKADASQSDGLSWVDDIGRAYANLCLNSEFAFWQLQSLTPTTLASYSDRDYGPDQWYIVTQTASVQYQRTTGDTRSLYAGRLKQNQAAAQRMGLVQPIEGIISQGLRGRSAALMLKARSSTTTTIHYAIAEWTGAQDAINADIVNDWASTNYSPGASNFFPASNWAVVAHGSYAITAADTWEAATKISGSVSASCNNLVIFVWTEGTAAQNVTLDITEVWVGEGTDQQVWMPTDPALDEYRCQRFLYVYAADAQRTRIAVGQSTSATAATIELRHHFRALPSLTVTADHYEVNDAGGGGNIACTSITLSTVSSAKLITLTIAVAAGLVAGSACRLQGDITDVRYLTLAARLGS